MMSSAREGSRIKLRLLCGAFLLAVIAAPLAAQDDLQNPNYLKKVVRNLAADNRAGAIYAFLENEFPEFSSILKRAGVAGLLDGKTPLSQFEQKWQVQKGIYEAEGGRLPSATAAGLYLAFKSALMTRPSGAPPQDRSVAAMLGQDRVAWVRNNMYRAADHPLRSWSQFETVEMAEVPGKLLWFNPDIAIPELGIKPGVPLTAEQEKAIVKLFSIRVAREVPEQRKVGKASYPSDVGRSVNPVTKALTIVDGNSGDVLGELTLKGTGLNPSTANQRIWNSGSPEGHLETDEGLTDSEVALRLRRALVNAYAPVAVIDVSAIPGRGMTSVGRAVYVRASESLVRWSPHLDEAPNGAKPLADMKLLLEYTAKEVGLNQAGRPFTVKEWAEGYMPRLQGRNAGTLAELGFSHTYHSGNVGPGFVMDFGEAELFNRGDSASYLGWYREALRDMIGNINKVLGPEQQISLRQAEATFNAAVAEGRAYVRATKPELRVSSRYLPKLDAEELGHLLSGYRDWIYSLKGGGNPFSDGSRERSKKDILAAEFKKWGLAVPNGKAVTAAWMSEQIIKKYDSLDGTAEGQRTIMRLIGGVEDVTRVESLYAQSLQAIRDRAREAGIRNPETLNKALLIQKLAKTGPVGGAQQDRAARMTLGQRVRTEARETGKFAAAYLLKEGVTALATGNPNRMEDAARSMATPEFWGSLAVFTGASRVAEKAITTGAVQKALPRRAGGLVKMAVPLAAGMAAMEAMSGRVDAKQVAISTGSYLGAGMAVSLAGGPVDAAMKAVRAAGPAGKIAFGAYEVGKLAAVLGLGEQAERLITENTQGR